LRHTSCAVVCRDAVVCREAAFDSSKVLVLYAEIVSPDLSVHYCWKTVAYLRRQSVLTFFFVIREAYCYFRPVAFP
jgi:hypothetical protein